MILAAATALAILLLAASRRAAPARVPVRARRRNGR